MEARYEQRLSMLDTEIRRHAQEVAQQLLDDFTKTSTTEAVAMPVSVVAERQWTARADFLELEARVGDLCDEVRGLSSHKAQQTQEVATLSATIAEVLRARRDLSPASQTGLCAAVSPPRSDQPLPACDENPIPCRLSAAAAALEESSETIRHASVATPPARLQAEPVPAQASTAQHSNPHSRISGHSG